MNILVTGGRGFIGRHLVNELVKRNHNVTTFDSLEYQVHGFASVYSNTRAKNICVDIKRINPGHLENIDTVIHLAAQVGVGQSMYDITRYVRDNCLGTAYLLEAMLEKRKTIKKLIVASSMSIYGEGYEGRGISETDLINPESVYAITKRDQEELCLAFGQAYEIPTVALRFFNTYGEYQSLNNPYTGVAAIFASRLLNNEPPIIFENGLQTRDFVHVSDIVQGIVKSITYAPTHYRSVFNLGTGVPTTVLDVANCLRLQLNKENIAPVVTFKSRKGDIRHCYADIDQARNQLGYEPRIAFDYGMARLGTWLAEQNSYDKVTTAYKELKDHDLIS